MFEKTKGMSIASVKNIVLVGNPNSGKTTLFNALTGSTAKVGNFAGVTVDLRQGIARTLHGEKINIIDLPGCYSLDDKAPDQKIARQGLLGEIEGTPKPDLAVCVVNAANLERHLLLAMEIMETGVPVILALNMVDLAEKSGLRLDPVKLSEELGILVVPMQANANKGVVELKQALASTQIKPLVTTWSGSTARREKAIEICKIAAYRPDAHQRSTSDSLDRVFLHPVFGWVIFAVIMFAIFWSIFSLSSIPMGWIESAQGAIEGFVEANMQEGDLRDLIIGGIVGGVGAVVVFLPQIIMLFFFIGLLESSGYMARAAYLMDGLMSRAGLSGKSFLPLLSSYACAIPGVMATRSIERPKERLIAIFVAPWMSCSARLPVYLLLIPLLLGGRESGITQSLIMTGIYIFGTLSAFVVARLLRGRLGPDAGNRNFILELPPYQFPQWRYIFRHLIERACSFIQKAGTIIMGLMILLWAAQTYPKSDSADPGERLSYSLIGRISNTIEPVVKPLGFDGRTGTAILTSFAAREVFVGSMAQLFHVDENEGEEDVEKNLRIQLAEATWPDGAPIFTPLAVISLIIFYIYALQCFPTSAVVAKESGSWKWAVGQFVFMTSIAGLASLLVFQIGKALGF
ncbi:MAG: ferrous iron transporter B [Chthoniobacterales bacterium]